MSSFLSLRVSKFFGDVWYLVALVVFFSPFGRAVQAYWLSLWCHIWALYGILWYSWFFPFAFPLLLINWCRIIKGVVRIWVLFLWFFSGYNFCGAVFASYVLRFFVLLRFYVLSCGSLLCRVFQIIIIILPLSPTGCDWLFIFPLNPWNRGD